MMPRDEATYKEKRATGGGHSISFLQLQVAKAALLKGLKFWKVNATQHNMAKPCKRLQNYGVWFSSIL